ncbi:MAG: oligosaccharide flippase family protein [Clostridia bacterium]|nr:oligosaccharide flippase family protein [Clostridia bacterium]
MEKAVIKRLFGAVVWVTLLSCVERLVGFIYRVYLSRTLGAESIAVYQIALSVVGVVVTLISSGIPITVSRLILKERANKNPVGEQEVVSAGILTSIAISLPITLALYLFKDKVCVMFADPRCMDVLLAILPGITVTGVYAVIRGYFWGNRQYLRYSLIELAEEVVMATAGVLLVSSMKDRADGGRLAGVAVFISYVFSFVVSTLVFVFGSGRLKNPLRRIKPLVISSSPITAMRTLSSLSSTLVALVLPVRLIHYGAPTAQAMTAFGEFSGMAMPLLFIPSTVIGSIALVTVPEVSGSFYEKNYRSLSETVVRSTEYSMLLSAVIVPIFVSCGRRICLFLYGSEQAGVYLAVSAITMLPMSLSMITTSLLNSVNKERSTLINYLLGAGAMFLIIFFTPKIIGVYALFLGHIVSFSLSSVLNLITLKKTLSVTADPPKKAILRLVAVAFSSAFGLALSGIVKPLPDILFIVTVAAFTLVFECVTLICFGLLDVKSIFGKLFVKRSAKTAKT